MTLTEFRRAVASNTNFKLSIKSFSFGKQAEFSHKILHYNYGSMLNRAMYAQISSDLKTFETYMASIPLEAYKALYKATETNLSAGQYVNNRLK